MQQCEQARFLDHKLVEKFLLVIRGTFLQKDIEQSLPKLRNWPHDKELLSRPGTEMWISSWLSKTRWARQQINTNITRWCEVTPDVKLMSHLIYHSSDTLSHSRKKNKRPENVRHRLCHSSDLTFQYRPEKQHDPWTDRIIYYVAIRIQNNLQPRILLTMSNKRSHFCFDFILFQ